MCEFSTEQGPGLHTRMPPWFFVPQVLSLLSLQRSYLRAFSSRWELNDLAAPRVHTHTTIYEKKRGSKSMK